MNIRRGAHPHGHRLVGSQRVHWRLLACAVVIALVGAGCYKRVYTENEDFVLNYDNKGKKTGYGTAHWPVNFIFYGPGASVGRVKDFLQDAGADSAGSPMYLYLKDFPSGGSWNGDEGEKDTLAVHRECDGPWLSNGYNYIHMRVYADGDAYLENSVFGRYVVGTSHWDYRENCHDAMFGWSEDAEQRWADAIYCEGYNFAEMHQMQNPESYRIDRGDHVWQSDGWARKVYVPTGTPSDRC